jgi:transcriptional regulator with XRE-family HTH domain
MQINTQLVIALRKKRSWSQEELATACGLNLRTVQRIESDGVASLQSRKALAAAFDVEVDELDIKVEPVMKRYEYKAVNYKMTHARDEARQDPRHRHDWTEHRSCGGMALRESGAGLESRQPMGAAGARDDEVAKLPPPMESLAGCDTMLRGDSRDRPAADDLSLPGNRATKFLRRMSPVIRGRLHPSGWRCQR